MPCYTAGFGELVRVHLRPSYRHMHMPQWQHRCMLHKHPTLQPSLPSFPEAGTSRLWLAEPLIQVSCLSTPTSATDTPSSCMFAQEYNLIPASIACAVQATCTAVLVPRTFSTVILCPVSNASFVSWKLPCKKAYCSICPLQLVVRQWY